MEGDGVWTRTANILVVDDDPEILRLIKTFLQDAGHAVETADNGQEALLLLARRSFDLAVLDLRMPGIDGFQLCAQIRSTERDRRMPILFLTAHYDDGEWSVRARELGADDFVLKPITRRALLARVGALLRLARSPTDRGSLAALRAIFETMLESTPACVLALDEKARVLAAAGKIVELLGAPVLPGTALDLALPRSILDAGRVEPLVRQALLGAREPPVQMTAVLGAKSRSLRLSARPVPSSSRGGLIRAVFVLEDTTDSAQSDRGVVDLGVADFAAAAADVATAIELRTNEVLSGLRTLGETGEQILRLAETAAAEVSQQLSLASLRVYWRNALKQSAVGTHEILKMARDLRGDLAKEEPAG